MSNISKKIIGIDLGTSTSEAACLIDGKPTIIPDLKGNLVISSVVYISDDDEVKVGEAAQNYALLEPENTVLEIKRLMGSKSFLKLGKKYLKPEEISGEILKYIKNYVEQYLGESVESAVITVPAYFTNEQRVATKTAGELAGFQVERIINEPTAAALAYGLDHMEAEKYLLVYDFGGGTLDVTVLEMFQGILDVKSSSGNNRLGGKDFDQALMDKLIKDFKKEQDISLDQNKKAMARLKEAAEKVKIELSFQEKAVIDLPFLGQKDGKPYGLHREITRGDLEKLIAPLVRSTLEQIDAALVDAKLNPEDMDTILLIGGSTKIPLVKDVLKKKFRREPKHEINPDQAVALGAAIQGGIITGELSEEQDIIITDICPFTLGIECAMDVGGMSMPGMFDPLIKRNTTIPVSTRKRYQTFVDDQEAVQVNVFQGEREIADDNNMIGSFMIEGIPQAKAGEEKVEVEFSYDINGILEVKAQVTSSGQDGMISIDTREMEIEEVIDVEKGWKKSKRSKKVRSLIKKGEKMLNDIFVDPEVKEELEFVLYELKYALTTEDDLFINRYEEELTEILYQAED